MAKSLDRYSRQTLFAKIGEEGQKKLLDSYVVIIGCGALGTMIATSLTRAGVGRIRIVDRDFIEYHNLQRQVLFDEDDIVDNLPKAIAAQNHLRKVNSDIEIEGIVADVNYTNIEELVKGADLIMDGLDNAETRYLINDASLKHNIPWIYGGAIAASGATMNVIPPDPPCFRCRFPRVHSQGSGLTCDTAGVIGPAPYIIGSLQSAEAIKILIGSDSVSRDLVSIDVWEGTYHRFEVKPFKDCPACNGNYDFLNAKFGTRSVSLCGQNAVQVLNTKLKQISLMALADKLKKVGDVDYSEHMLQLNVDGNEMVVFPDGRIIVKNTNDESLARGLYSKYIGI